MVGSNRRQGFDKGIIVLGLIVLILGASSIILYTQLRSDKITDDIKDQRPINILFMVHEQESLVFSELFLYQPLTGKGALFDVPGTWGDVIDSLERMDRIDVLYRPGNPAIFKEKVSELFGVDIPYFVDFNVSDVEDAVDLLEGLEMFIANPVELEEGDEIILVPSGSVVLDGMKAVQFVSFVDANESDLEYRGRHQKFVQSLLKRMSEKSEYMQNATVFDVFYNSMDTNIGKRAFEALVKELGSLNVDYIVSKLVHGDKVAVDDQILLFPHFKGNLVRESVRQTIESLANTEVLSEAELTVALEILNGTEQTGLASRTAQLFANFGYEVARIGNADREDYAATVVIARSDLSVAQKLAGLIGCTNVEQEQTTSSEMGTEISPVAIDVTIILGLDFDGRYCK